MTPFAATVTLASSVALCHRVLRNRIMKET